jgi:hypothetical protein
MVYRVVICGGGIIGAATAFYLAQQGVGATVIEREAVAAAASGKAGGFLALDWNDSSPVGPLARCAIVFMACTLPCSWHAWAQSTLSTVFMAREELVAMHAAMPSKDGPLCYARSQIPQAKGVVVISVRPTVLCCACRRSYALHAELANKFGRDTIGYREVDTIQVCGTLADL